MRMVAARDYYSLVGGEGTRISVTNPATLDVAGIAIIPDADTLVAESSSAPSCR
ncbi:hypothetical protein [Mesorhizobium sp. 2RAF21]|uniref:hypothetical protein n=1 Tax=Mesorhizobium sp. 2RAF21 TaxID=3232995 RepID=UPI003F958C40